MTSPLLDILGTWYAACDPENPYAVEARLGGTDWYVPIDEALSPTTGEPAFLRGRQPGLDPTPARPGSA